jgi:uncharacterized protein YbaR (Trm112 family)
MKEALLDTICPQCKNKLETSVDRFYCLQCSKEYPITDGIPILLKEHNYIIFEKSDEKPVQGVRRWIRRLLQLKPDPQCSTATQSNIKFIAYKLARSDKVLLVGGGINAYGKFMHELGPPILTNSINLEVTTGSIVDIVADGHDIPFPNNYFKAVICQAVLEHTKDSQRVVAEMHRVLKPEGIIYAEIPFLAPVHMTSDFRRFTLAGIQELFSAFNTIRTGVNGSVASAYVMISINFYATLFSFGNSSLYQVGRFVFSWLLTPIKYLDWIFYKFTTATISSSAMYFLGIKRDNQTVS